MLPDNHECPLFMRQPVFCFELNTRGSHAGRHSFIHSLPRVSTRPLFDTHVGAHEQRRHHDAIQHASNGPRGGPRRQPGETS